MTGRILIFSGGALGPWALQEIAAGDFLLGVDRGALFLIENGRQPDLAIGDFDSVTPTEFALIRQASKQCLSCDPVAKDETDTELAFNWALARRPREILLLGATGSRLDHTLANLHLLARALQEGIPCRMADEKNEVMLIQDTTEITKGRFSHISLLPLTDRVTGITLTGFRYPLHRATLTLGQSLGISNILQAPTGKIEIAAGRLLVIKSRD
ncbi:thiamine diphosphokinase [Desulforamulus hydrothermalis]|uniref:Thiamine diphosphokinase n=1 Tax=Desulforamulus hydrothermalis Lam5 = DSM 18033 TaxID=1121428 RepID=K8DZI3_9FIRM|nr:thiamine diphosphokinase [Desulforamulus hydrothermalis]CCO08380.1 Thiamine diphosphokinase [Desulforamulus hydrothermalis Lam5 = DSM 18033]SHH14278.1 thiamine pyrophosphokinase [Desulforamulus hydrothermalis Lam5 = DSM 18033]